MPSVHLERMTLPEFPAYLEADTRRYAEENVKAGFFTDRDALEKSRQAHAALLPEGLATKNHLIFHIIESASGVHVGVLWMGIDPSTARPSGFVYDLFIEEAYRRKGYATAAMKALEEEARTLGLKWLGLHVFAQNLEAQVLYRRLGYEVVGLNMMKPLGEDTR